jgi:hypothetical protein
VSRSPDGLVKSPGQVSTAKQPEHTVTDEMIAAFYAEIDAPVAVLV